ncbi:MSC_0621 family F1-like ATPase epsilon subunit [Mycoplasmopsis columbina]|uniref:Uncharacterized protein n=1 Tax=Mycoplasmopsis columbina SF7 TaxID=1037410 RepID=F9UJ45_9BACT|nr:hypothetical protein [Mycoplasmopsis columbina]EGV00608.1 hypothetical protein MCSF7_00110 [Mycoplasmopsis columbina SF7]VEU76661.1 Uncharacterised protein [Mycoplasmopsis columbina]
MKKLILFSSNKDVKELDVQKIFVNNRLKDEWIEIENKTIASFKNILLKLELENNEIIYMLIDTLLVKSDDSEVTFYYHEYLETFEQFENKNLLKTINKEYKETKRKMQYIKALQNIKTSYFDETEIELLEKKLYKLKAQLYFSLSYKELKWN